MTLVDANLLVYAKLADMPHHAAARDWLEKQFNGASRVGLPWESLSAFLRITTNPRIFPKPLPAEVAWAQVEEWLGLPTVWVPLPVPTHASLFGHLVVETAATAGRVPDAHLAAIAIGHGLTLCSADAGFRIYRGLKLLNPISA